MGELQNQFHSTMHEPGIPFRYDNSEAIGGQDVREAEGGCT